jgi:hypothetical protein
MESAVARRRMRLRERAHRKSRQSAGSSGGASSSSPDGGVEPAAATTRHATLATLGCAACGRAAPTHRARGSALRPDTHADTTQALSVSAAADAAPSGRLPSDAKTLRSAPAVRPRGARGAAARQRLRGAHARRLKSRAAVAHACAARSAPVGEERGRGCVGHVIRNRLAKADASSGSAVVRARVAGALR